MTPTLTSQDAADLADALARGRLCMAEVADIRPAELNALFEVGARRLEHGAVEDAVQVMAALAMLFPYSAKYWRGYAVCLHRQGTLEQAAAAYRAAVLLDPDHGMSQCYLGEVLVQLGDSAGLAYVRAASQSADESARARATVLLRALQPQVAPAEPPGAVQALSVEPTDPLFSAEDGRPLPLQDGRFSVDDGRALRPTPEPVTDRMFVAAAPREVTGTDTALVPLSPAPAKLRDNSQASVTAQVDRRPRPAPQPSRPPPVLPTAWRRRKQGLPLTDEVTLNDEVTLTDVGDDT